jgi:fibro-slime domain-containing protein
MSRTRRSPSRKAPATAVGEPPRAALALALGACCLAACAATKPEAPDGGAGASGAAGTAGVAGVPPLVLDPIPSDGYTMEQAGGYQLGRAIPAAQIQMTPTAASSTGCNRLRGIVRDFKGALPAFMGPLQPGGHPDFEVFQGENPTKGLVAAALSAERKPVYASKCELGVTPSQDVCPYGAMTTSAPNFDQWYRSDDAVNKTFFVYFQLDGPSFGISRFSSMKFFPVDGVGWGNSGLDNDQKTPRNYSFTTEIHTTFQYNGGETFTFTGDDDVWIFINGKLAVDLGGLHMLVTGKVSLDDAAPSLGITKGSVYPLDLFHAERHSVSSDFGFEMNFNFQDCGYIVP